MDLHDLEKAWMARAPLGPIFMAPTFVGDRLILGAKTEIAVARKELAGPSPAHELDVQMIALLSAFYGVPVSDRALAHLRRALEKQAEDDALLASTHLALAGYWPPRDPLAAARRAFLCDGLMKHGTAPAASLDALNLDPHRCNVQRFDPSQPRVPPGNGVESGRWTSDGRAAGQSEVSIDREHLSDEDSLYSESLPKRVVEGLIRLATQSSIASIVFDTLFIPSGGKSGVTEGNVSGQSDLQYDWDKPAGQVLFRIYIDGHWVMLTAGRDNLNQFYRDADGNIIARAAGDSLVVDLGALDRARERLSEGSGGQPPQQPSSDERGGPKLCPETSKESNEGWSTNSRAYQQYVSGLGHELAIWLNGVLFDGCDPATGFMLEAKARYELMLNPDGSWRGWTADTQKGFLDQMTKQADAAALDGRHVVWHVQEQPFAAALQKMSKGLNRPNLQVTYDPGPP